jgi:hypothetical protein
LGLVRKALTAPPQPSRCIKEEIKKKIKKERKKKNLLKSASVKENSLT